MSGAGETDERLELLQSDLGAVVKERREFMDESLPVIANDQHHISFTSVLLLGLRL